MWKLPEPDTLRNWAAELGFSSLGVARIDLARAASGLDAWLVSGMHGEMDYMARHRDLRAEPARLQPGTVRALMVTMDYRPEPEDWRERAREALADRDGAYLSVYARGRDYHRVMRQRLQTLAERITRQVGAHRHRVCCDSAPVMEVELARAAGLGWRGKHSLLIDRHRGSMFFLGALLTELPLPADSPADAHCGRCMRCIEICPTGAIVEPYRVDARRCVSYLTIELRGAIPRELRPSIGNRVYGCDDCQLACPWNRYARAPAHREFEARHGLDIASLITLFAWSERDFDERTRGSAVRRLGWTRWLRNLAVGLGNATPQARVIEALGRRADHPSELVREHVAWALERQRDGLRACQPARTQATHNGSVNSPPSIDKVTRRAT